MMVVTSNLLILEPPLQVLPSLAIKIGLNRAILLQQFHYWLERSEHEHDGRKWIYNTYEQWHEQFPFWSMRTLKGIVGDLIESGILLREHLNDSPFDRTNWYSIDYDQLASVHSAEVAQSDDANIAQSDGAEVAPCSLNREYQETTTENIPAQEQQTPLYEHVWPAWYTVLYSVPKIRVSLEDADKWRTSNNISEDLAEQKAYALRDWWETLPASKQVKRNTYYTWQNWCRRDRDKQTKSNGNYPARPGRAKIEHNQGQEFKFSDG